MMLRSLVLSVALLFGIMANSASGDRDMYRGMNRDKVREIQRLIEANLKVGASSEEIEAFLDKFGISGSYDRYNNRYNSIIRDVAHDPKLDQSVVIHLFVGDNKRFRRAEVFDSFTDNMVQEEITIDGGQLLLIEVATAEFRKQLTDVEKYSVSVYEPAGEHGDVHAVIFEDPDLTKPRNVTDKLPTLVVLIDNDGKVVRTRLLR